MEKDIVAILNRMVDHLTEAGKCVAALIALHQQQTPLVVRYSVMNGYFLCAADGSGYFARGMIVPNQPSYYATAEEAKADAMQAGFTIEPEMAKS